MQDIINFIQTSFEEDSLKSMQKVIDPEKFINPVAAKQVATEVQKFKIKAKNCAEQSKLELFANHIDLENDDDSNLMIFDKHDDYEEEEVNFLIDSLKKSLNDNNNNIQQTVKDFMDDLESQKYNIDY